MGPAKAARIAAAFQLARRARPEASRPRIAEPEGLAAVAGPLLHGLRRERVVVVVGDSSSAVLRTVLLTEGASDRSLIPVRDVLAVVLAAGGTTFGVAHNHPSGNPEPSEPDRFITARLQEAAAMVGLRFTGHVVVTDAGWREIKTER
jgi:DNA repair protein RadC